MNIRTKPYSINCLLASFSPYNVNFLTVSLVSIEELHANMNLFEFLFIVAYLTSI